MTNSQKLTKEQSHIIKVVTIGGILEWYEIYSFIYLAPILGKLFFNFDSDIINTLNAYLIFGIGFLTRPFGAILFGRIGDLIGRKRAFISSMIVITVPTFLMGCLPTYSSIGILAPILFYLLRIFQSIPAASEIPGTICFLYENSDKKNIHFMSSCTYIGNQIGGIIALLETILLDYYLEDISMHQWGWRVLFWSGGFIGLFGLYLRSKLVETPTFRNLKMHPKKTKGSLFKVINKYKWTIVLGIAFGAINASSFYLFSTYIPTYIELFTNINAIESKIWMIILLLMMTILMPLIGKYIDKSGNKKVFITSSILIIILTPFLYFSLIHKISFIFTLIGCIFIFPIAGISATYPYWIARIFKPKMRYTSIGLAFNFSDAIFGSLTPALSLLFFRLTSKSETFCWYILFSAFLSIFAYNKIKKINYN
jgi:MHS family proline/betaine transporter-like MFS transporter